MIVNSYIPVTLLGGGDSTAEDLRIVLKIAPILVAADGAAQLALDAGLMPDAVIGDLDSLAGASRARIPAGRIHHIPEQESTDFDKCLRSIRAPLVLGLGFMGQRLDHELAALSTLVERHQSRCILIGPVDLCFHAPPELRLELPAGTRVSLFPLDRVGVTGAGLEWPVDGVAFRPGGRIGTSNSATGPVQLRFDRPGMLVILPREHLGAAVAALHPQGEDRKEQGRQGALPPLR